LALRLGFGICSLFGLFFAVLFKTRFDFSDEAAFIFPKVVLETVSLFLCHLRSYLLSVYRRFVLFEVHVASIRHCVILWIAHTFLLYDPFRASCYGRCESALRLNNAAFTDKLFEHCTGDAQYSVTSLPSGSSSDKFRRAKVNDSGKIAKSFQ